MKRVYYLLCLILLLSFSCKRYSSETEQLFKQAKQLLDVYPDSVLMLLEKIHNPYELNDAQRFQYVLLFTQAKDKNYEDITAENAIFEAKDYYSQKKDTENEALATFYCGRVLDDQGKKEEAINNYLKAAELATLIHDNALVGLSYFFIGNINYDQFFHDEAIPYFKKAAHYFSHCQSRYQSETACYTNIGNLFVLKNLSDSAFFYYNKGMELASLNNDPIEQVHLLNSMSVASNQMGDTRLSREYIREALSMLEEEESELRPRLYSTLSKIYLKEHKIDSARYYSHLALECSNNDNPLKISLYKHLSKIEQMAGNYKVALRHHTQYGDHLASEIEEKVNYHILDVQKKYNFELLQNAKRKIEVQRLWITIFSLVSLALISFIFYRNRIKHREASSKANEQIYLLKGIVSKQEEAISNSKEDQEKHQMRIALFNQLDIITKISSIESYLSDVDREKGKNILKKVNEILYESNEKINWKIFYEPLDALYDNFTDRLKKTYPKLKETDILICCLSLFKYNAKEIGLFLGKTQNAIQKRKIVIKEAMKMNNEEDFFEQLDRFAKQNSA